MSRRSLRSPERNYLWSVSGGICSYKGCNKRLIRNDSGFLNTVGEIAHIIGNAENSARHEFVDRYESIKEDLECVENLMIMCQEHHTIIDGHQSRVNYPPDLLFQWKREHEEKVISWGEEKKKSIALIHKRFGSPINKIPYGGEPPYILLDAVEEQEEFIDFTSKGWQEGKDKNIELKQEFESKIQENEADILEIFAMSPIPLLIHLGFLLSDTVPYTIYQWDREEEYWVHNQPQSEVPVSIKLKQDNYLEGNDEIAIAVGVSGRIHIKDVKEALNKASDILLMHTEKPSVKNILYRNEVKEIQIQVKERIEYLISEYDYKKIHLFCAVPAGLAIEIGRGINENIWGKVCLYEYKRMNSPRYHFAISLP